MRHIIHVKIWPADDKTRVVLSDAGPEPDSDYINANFITVLICVASHNNEIFLAPYLMERKSIA